MMSGWKIIVDLIERVCSDNLCRFDIDILLIPLLVSLQRYFLFISMFRLGDEEEGNDSQDGVYCSGEEKHPGNSGQEVGVSEVTITERQVRVAARV